MKYTQIIFDITLMVFLGYSYYQDKVLKRRINTLVRNDEGGDRPLRSSTDGRRDERARTTGKIPQEPQEIRETNKSTSGTSRGRLETKQTPESTIITQEGLPPSPSLNELAKSLKKTKDPLETITDFGTNYPEYYHDGKGAIEKLLQEKQGQVQGAFYKEGLGDIDLVWGKVTNAEKHTGFGLGHIIDKHPDFDITKIPEIIEKGNLSPRHNGYNLESENFIVGINKGFDGKGDNTWIVTAFDSKKPTKLSSSRDFTKNESLSSNLPENLTTEQLKNQLDEFDDFIQKRLPLEPMLTEEEVNTLYNKILLDWLKEHPNMDTDFVMMYDHYLKNKMINKTPAGFTRKGKELSSLSLDGFNHYKDKILSKKLPKQELETITDFGTNYPEYYHDGKGAIEKLLQEKQGQVQGAFYKEGLGDIDLVWGDSKMGLAHILEKHPEVIEKIPEIIEKGEIDKGTNRVFLNTNDSRLAIALDYKGKDKKWIITAYDKDYPSSAYPHQEQLTPTTSAHRMQDNLEVNPNTEKLKNQHKPSKQTEIENKHLLDQLLNADIEELVKIKKNIGNEKIPTINRFEDILRDTGITRMKEALKVENYLKSPQEILKYFTLKGKLTRLEEEIVHHIADNEEMSNFKKNLKSKLHKESSRITGYTNSFSGNNTKHLLAELKDKAKKMPYDNLEYDEKKIITYLKEKRIGGFVDFDWVQYYHKGKKAIDKLLEEKEGRVKGAFYRERFGDINLSFRSLDKIKDDFGLVAVTKLPDIINNGKIFRNPNPKDNSFYIIKDGFMLKMDIEHNIINLIKWDNQTIQDFMKKLEPISSPQKSVFEEISDFDKLSYRIKNNYDEFKITQTSEYQNEKEIYEYATNPLKKGLLSVKDADDFLLSNNPLKIKQYDNYVKEKLKEPFGINFVNNLDKPFKGITALQTLLTYKLGQVKGAFHKEGLGDIDLVWGDSKMGLAHILEKHPEVIDRIPEIIEKGEVIKNGEFETIVLKNNELYKVGLSKGWNGNGENHWVLTAYEDTRLPHSDLLPSNGVTSRDVLPSNNLEINPTTEQLKNQELNLEEISDKLYGVFKRYYNEFKITKTPEYQNEKGIYEYATNHLKKGLLSVKDADDFLLSNNPLKIKQYDNYVKEKLKEPFGVNFISRTIILKGREAILTLLNYKLGQVKGAFHKEGLGDIDLVWGDSKMGLAHILEKHPEVIDRIPEIIEKGEVIKNGRFETIVFEDNGTYKVGLSKGWHDKGDNSWVITAYEDTRLLHSDALPSNGVASRDVLPSNNLEVNPTTEQLKNQELLEESKEDLIKEAFSEFSSQDTLSETTKQTLEKSGRKVETEGENILIHHPVERSDKDLEPLNTPSTPEAIITPNGYTQYDGLGNIVKEISITPDTLSSIEKQGNITTIETLDLTTNKSTKEVEVTNPEVLVPITSPSSSSAPSSSIIAKLKDDFKIDPNATLPKSPKKRFDNNIEAIRILKKLEQTKTLPTLEEKQKLSLYVGWGGLSNSFKDNSPEDKLLKELLSEEEYIRARNSTLSSYYTPYFVVDSMYKALQKMGFRGGEILEPSVGVGNFFGLLPDSLRHTSNLRGIELDDTTAKIAKYLYPSAKIEHTGYENALLPQNNYDLVIGNPPYGSFSVYDKNFKKESKHNIHNYFMLKNLALTKENGILAQIITTNFLDTKNPEVRELIAKEAEFLGAIRLPQGSFDDTQVATDIVFFKKLKKGETASFKEWVNLKSIPDSQGKEDIPINSYFVNNPQYMLGTPGRYGGMYGADTVGFKANGNTQVQLQKAIEEMTEGIHIDTAPIIPSVDIAQKTIDNLTPKSLGELLHSSYIRPGGIALDSKSKEIYRLNQNEELEKVPDLELIDKTQEEFDKLTEIGKKAKLAQIKRIKEIIPAISKIRDTLMHLKRLQLDPMQPDSLISSYRKELNTLYDDFRNTFHTFLSDNKIAKAFDGDPTYPHIAALEEDYKRVDKKYQAKKADIFTKRTQFPYVKPTKAKDIEDGIFISYNQTGRLDFDTIASLLDKNSESIKKEMLDKNLAFKDISGDIVYAPEFLSGDIKAKIKSFEEKELDEYQNKALNALLKVVPPKVEIEGIGINMGANYIPIEIYQDFAKEVLGGGENAVSYQKLTDEFIVNFKSSIEADKAFGVEGKYKSISASDVFDSALNDRKITMGKKVGENFHPDTEGQNAFDQQIGIIKEAFKNFIYEDYKRAEKIENVYNDIFNNTKLREFDGSFLKLEGSNNLITLRPHQKNAIYRVISSPTTLLDHTVGTGKTYTMVGSAMELRRLGLAQKPLIVVPNHIVNQFGAEFARLYPDANILATRKFDKKSRQRTLSAITTGDWDAIIIGHSNFEMLPMSKQSEMKFIGEQIVTFAEAIRVEKIQRTGSDLSVKKLESALESKKRKLNELIDAKRDETIHFEDLGIDALFLDEAHEFKNLEFFSRQNISGLGSQKGSKKAFDLFMKTRYLRDKNKKIIFATGTPISNSIAELYTLQKYLDFQGLEKKGINSFDQWSKTFGKVESRFEYHPKGDFKLTKRFSGYINMPELIKEYKKFSDVIVNEDVEAMLKLQGKEFDLPKADFITATIKKSPRQEKFMQEIMDRSLDIDTGKVEPYEDNYLKVTTDGKKGSLDMRLIDPLYEDNPDSKVNTSIANIIKEYNKWKQDKGTQLVFLDMSTPKNKNPKAKKELNELLKRIEQGDEEAEEILRAKGGSDYIKIINNDGFSVYEDIKDKLIKEGIPEKEIAFIHDFDTDKKKAELFTKVNDGEVRILLGSTSKMGAGTNVQERIVAIHHLDAPWRPADIEQRNGRGIRQGNSLYEKYGKDKFKVNIYTYVTKGMLDTMIFEKLHTKAKFISQLRKGDLSGREIEDIGDEVLNFAEIQAATLEDRRYLEILELKRDIDSLTALQKNIANINLRTTREINALEYEVKNKPKEIQAFKSDMEHFNKAGNKVQIGNNTYIKGEKNNGLSEALEGIRIDRDIQSIYKYNDFIIQASVSKRNADYGYIDLIAHSPNTEESYLISTTKKQDFKPNGALTKIDNYFKAQRLLAMQNELKNAQIALPKLKNSLKKFDKQKELEEKTKRHIKLIEDLRVKLNSHPYVGLGLFGAISGGEIDYNQDGKNDEGDILLGALGAIIGGRAVKYLLTRNKDVIKNVLLHHFPDKKEDIDTAFKKEVQKEKRGIYNVAYNNKKATIIKEDLKSIENAILFEEGTQSIKVGFGAKHINARHSNPKDIGYITQQEYLDLGNHIREYIKEHKEPFIDKNGSRIYEWKNKNGVSFRVVIGDKRKGASHDGSNRNQLPFHNRIITFYSDRNLNKKMKFRNPNLNDKGVKIW